MKRKEQKLIGLGFLVLALVVFLMGRSVGPDMTVGLVFIPLGLYLMFTKRIWVF